MSDVATTRQYCYKYIQINTKGAMMKITKLPVISISAFLSSVAIGIAQLGLIFLMKLYFNASAGTIGIFGATWSISYFISCIIFRRVTRKILPRFSLLITLFGTALVFLIFLLKPNIPLAFVTYILFGVLTAFYWPPLMSWLSKGYNHVELARANGVFNFSWSFGGVLSSYIAGILSKSGRFYPLVAAAILFTLNGIFILVSFFFVKDSYDIQTITEPPKFSLDQKQNPNRIPAWISNMFTYLVIGIIFNIFPVFANDVLHYSEPQVGLILSLRALATMIGFILLGQWHFWHFKSWVMPCSALAITISLVSMSLLNRSLTFTGYTIFFIVIGLSMAATYTTSLFYSTVNSSNKDTMVTIHESLLTFGQVIGSSAGGIIYMHTSFAIMLLLLGTLFIVMIVLQLAYFKKVTH